MLQKISFAFCSLFVIMNAMQASTQNSNNALREEIKNTIPHQLYRLPSKEVLDKNIKDQYFKEKTKIHEKLADKQLYGLGIDIAIETSCYDFIKYLKKGDLSTNQLNTYKVTTNMNKPILKSQILKDTIMIEEPDTEKDTDSD